MKQISKNTPGTTIRVLLYPTNQGDENRSVVAFDAFSINREEVQNPTLWFQFVLVMTPKSRWKKYVSIYDCDSEMIDLSESMSGSGYSDACNKYMVVPNKNDQLVVTFAAWIDITGLTKHMRYPCQPFLINLLSPKREYQRNRLLAYVPCTPKSSTKKREVPKIPTKTHRYNSITVQ